MNIDHFIYFVELVHKNGFTKAAESLFVSQSTISKAIRALEKEYDVELIERTAKKFRLTSEGEIFYNSALKIISNYKAETEFLHSQLKSKNGALYLGVPPVTVTAIYPIIWEYRQRYPNVNLNILEVGANRIYSLVKQGAIDMGVVIQPFTDPDFFQVPVMQSEAVLLVPPEHKLASLEAVRFSRLQHERFLLLSNEFMLHDVIIDSCKHAGFMPKIEGESAQWDLLVESVANGSGITILPKPIIDKFCGSRVCQLHLMAPEIPWIPTVIYHHNKFVTSPMTLFLEMLKEKHRR